MNYKRTGIIRAAGIFLLIAFLVTTNIILFLRFLDYNEAQLRVAAPLTMANVLFLTLILCAIDRIRYLYSVKKPVEKISAGIKKAMSGDYSVRIAKGTGLLRYREYDVITDDLNGLFKELGSVETLRGDFIASVSHELKTPMAVIQNYATLLGAPNITEEKRAEYCNRITDQTRKLSLMVSNILKLNKLENQQIFPDMERLDLSESVCESILGFETVWEEKELTIETELSDGISINGDKEMLSLVWTNLMSNAVKFTDKGGSIRINVYKEASRGVFRIEDTGCGMDRDTGEKIFNKFYQGDTSHSGKGNGLGLALVKRIVDIHNGEISVSSALGKGSCFTVKLKLTDTGEA